MIKKTFLALLTSLSLWGLGFSSISAQPAGAEGDNFIYIVEPGDTLGNLAELYTTRSQLWRQLQQINQIADPAALPIGKQLKIPFDLIPVVATEATLIHSQGPVWVNEQSVSHSLPLKSGDTIRTGATGFATLQLEDQSTLSLPNNSQLHIKQLNAFERARLTDAILELQSGTLETRVAPDQSGVGRFEVHTPISVTGVRGTDLRIHAHTQSTNAELLSGKAQFTTSTHPYQTLQPAQGVVITPNGNSQISPLLPAPHVSAAEQGSTGWHSVLEPVAGADHYIVQITLDPEGAQVVNRFTLAANQTIIPLRSSGPGDHFAFIRAVDQYGLMGLDSHLSFPGQLTLTSSDGASIFSGYGLPILLNEY